MYVFVENKNILARKEIYGSKIKTIQCYTETIKLFGQELMGTTYTQNTMTVGVVVANKKNKSPQTFCL
jgi:hypothetical protein